MERRGASGQTTAADLSDSSGPRDCDCGCDGRTLEFDGELRLRRLALRSCVVMVSSSSGERNELSPHSCSSALPGPPACPPPSAASAATSAPSASPRGPSTGPAVPPRRLASEDLRAASLEAAPAASAHLRSASAGGSQRASAPTGRRRERERRTPRDPAQRRRSDKPLQRRRRCRVLAGRERVSSAAVRPCGLDACGGACAGCLMRRWSSERFRASCSGCCGDAVASSGERTPTAQPSRIDSGSRRTRRRKGRRRAGRVGCRALLVSCRCSGAESAVGTAHLR